MSELVRFSKPGQILGSGIVERPQASTGAAASPMSAAEIIDQLERAGAALLAMPARGPSTRLRQMRFDIVHTALEAYGWDTTNLKPPAPSAAAITSMDEAFAWLLLIPEQSYLLRRILGARSLVHPITGRHLYPWRRLASALGADHKSVQRWHAKGVTLILKALTKT